jgi:tRNA(fMet)-specific endonuclease VapC
MTGITRPTYLVDTVAAIALLNRDQTIKAAFGSNTQISIPIITLGELYTGAENSGRVEENLRRVDEFASDAEIIFCDHETAREYGRISRQLRKKGRPIPQNDMWIAALAIQHNFILVTRDKHFSQIDGLQVKAW